MCKLCNSDKKPKEYILDVVRSESNHLFREVAFQYTSEYPCEACIKAYGIRVKDMSIDDFIINRLRWSYISFALDARDIRNARMKLTRVENQVRQVRVSKNIRAMIGNGVVIGYLVHIRNKAKCFPSIVDAIEYRDSIAFKPKGRSKIKRLRIDDCLYKAVNGRTGNISYTVKKRVNKIDISKSFKTLEEARGFLSKLEQ